jgi:hypothetical protein
LLKGLYEFEGVSRMKANGIVVVLFATAATAIAFGCKKTDNSSANYTKAINMYYASRPACLWSDPLKLPVQADTSDTVRTSGFDALVDQGLMTRTTAEKTKMIILSKQVTNYDFSDKGRSSWTADQQQPGFGNFCYGSKTVTSIDGSTPTSDQPGATTTVSYHVALSGAPAWASAPETQNAFPQVREDLAGPTVGSATLTNTANGWSVTSGPLQGSHRVITNADGAVVQ